MDYRYQEIPPRPPLDRFVQCFWTLQGPRRAPPAPAEPVLPDGSMELVLNFADPFRREPPDGPSEVQPRQLVVGQMQRPIRIAPTGAVDLLGARLRPAGASALFGLPASELSGRILPLDAVGTAFRREARAALTGEETRRERIGRLETLLLRRVPPPDSSRSRIEAVAGEILRRHGQVRVAALAAQAGVSARHLEREFGRTVGLEPKVFCRIIRFQRVLAAVERADSMDWVGVALECGYYDQAHLIRDFRQFAGAAPRALFQLRAPLTEVFSRKNGMSDFSKTRGAPFD